MLKKDEKGDYFCESFQDVFDAVLGHKPLSHSNHVKLSWVFDVFIKSSVPFYNDFKAPNSHDFCFSERGQAFGCRFFELFTRLTVFIN